jgi:hypothetical protein
MPLLRIYGHHQGANGTAYSPWQRAGGFAAALQAEALRHSKWVGDAFADVARAMHHGDLEPTKVHGQTSRAEAIALVQEGVPVAALPLPVPPPDQVN